MARIEMNEIRDQAIEQEHEEWLQDTATWREEHHQVIELLSNARTWLEEQADLLDEHEKRIRNHNHHLVKDQEYARTTGPRGSSEAVEKLHLEQQHQNDLDHELVRKAHRNFKASHAAVMHHVTDLLNSLRYEQQR